MPTNIIAANALGTLGAIFWSIQLLPQIWLNYRRHHARGLQSSMMLLWTFAGVPLGVYNVSKDFNVALKIQPQILTTLSLITWAQCRYYKRGWSVTKCVVWVSAIACTLAGLEIGLIFALKPKTRRHAEWPLILMAVLSALFLALGVLRHYIDIWQHRSVRGISIIFVGLDAAGDLTSILSLIFQPKFDLLGCIIYATELLLWIGILLLCLVYGCTDQSGHSERQESAQETAAAVSLDRTSSRTSVTSVFHTVASRRRCQTESIRGLTAQ